MFVCVVEPGSVPTFLPVLHIKGPGVTASIWSSSHLRYLTLQWQVIKHTLYPSCNTGWPEGNEKGTNKHTQTHRHKHSKAGFFHWRCTIYCVYGVEKHAALFLCSWRSACSVKGWDIISVTEPKESLPASGLWRGGRELHRFNSMSLWY